MQVIKWYKNSEGKEINVHWSGQERLSRWNRALAGPEIVIKIGKEEKKGLIEKSSEAAALVAAERGRKMLMGVDLPWVF